jgi:hypothetical protein
MASDTDMARKKGSWLMVLVTLVGVAVACLAGLHLLNPDLEPVGGQGRGLMGLMVALHAPSFHVTPLPAAEKGSSDDGTLSKTLMSCKICSACTIMEQSLLEGLMSGHIRLKAHCSRTFDGQHA